MGGNEKRNVNVNQARTVKGESELFVNTVLEGMTADIFIEKWKNDVDLILDLEENPEYGEKKLFDDLLARMTNYYENNQNSTGPASYFNMLLKKPENVGKEKEYNEQLESIDKAWQRVKSQWSNYTEDLKTFLRVFDISFQVDDEGNVDVVADAGETEERTQISEYNDDKMSINAKNSASKTIKLLIATVADSEFVKKTALDLIRTSGEGFGRITPIRENTMRMRMLAPYAKLFNYVLHNTANTPGIYNMIDKLKDLSQNTSIKQNANLKALLNRIKFNKEEGFEKLSIHQIKVILKLENSFSTQTPTYVRHVITRDGKTVFKYSITMDRASQLAEQWGDGLLTLKFVMKQGSILCFSKDILSADYYTFLNNLNIPITRGKIPCSKENAFFREVDVIKAVVADYINSPLPTITKGRNTGIDSRLKTIAELFVENIEGESLEASRFTLDAKVTSNYLLPSYVSKILAEANVLPTLQEFVNKNPQYKDLYMKNSFLLNKVLYNDGKKNKKLNIMVVEGMGIIGHSRPTYRMTKVERAVYEINNNFNGIFYFLKPSDSPLEYAIDPGNLVPKSFFYSTSKKEDTINFVNEMYNSLKNEIKLMKDFKNRKGIVSISRKVDGVEIGRKLRFFRDILSTASVTNIESGYEIEKNEFTIELLNYISKKAQLTIDYLVSNKIIINNILYGFDNTFIKNIYFDKNGKTHSLSKFQMLELFTYREMNYLFYKIEISNFFFNDPAQCENELIFKTYLLAGRNYTHVDFLNDKRGLNEALKVKLNKELSPADIGWTNFKNYISTVVIKDIKLNSTHSIFNERILNNNSRHFINLGNKQVESFIHCNCYRELLYKSAGKFTSQDEELHQWLIAFERHDKAKQKKYVYTSNKLECQDKLVLSKPIPSSNKHILKAFEIIACGIKLVNGVAFQFFYRSITAPMYYYFIKDTPLELVYGKMAKNKIDFLLYENSVHAGLLLNNTTSLFDSNGNISDEFDSVILNQIDFNHLGINLL